MKVIVDYRIKNQGVPMKKSYTVSQLKKELFKNPKFKEEYNKLEPEMQIARQIIAARIAQNISQSQLAKKVGTGQAAISRIENMNAKPTLNFLQRIASALDTTLHLTIS